MVVVEPVPGLTGKKEEELADRLAAIKDRMTEEEKAGGCRCNKSAPCLSAGAKHEGGSCKDSAS